MNCPILGMNCPIQGTPPYSKDWNQNCIQNNESKKDPYLRECNRVGSKLDGTELCSKLEVNKTSATCLSLFFFFKFVPTRFRIWASYWVLGCWGRGGNPTALYDSAVSRIRDLRLNILNLHLTPRLSLPYSDQIQTHGVRGWSFAPSGQ